MRSQRRSRGAHQSVVAPSPCIWAARLKKSPRQSTPLLTGAKPNGPLFWPRSQRSAIPSRAPEANTSYGLLSCSQWLRTVDMTDELKRRLSDSAPGFRDCVLSRRISSPAALESMDANLLGGDIMNGAMNLRQLFFRADAARLLHWHAESLPLFRQPHRPAEASMVCAAIIPRSLRCANSKRGIAKAHSASHKTKWPLVGAPQCLPTLRIPNERPTQKSIPIYPARSSPEPTGSEW